MYSSRPYFQHQTNTSDHYPIAVQIVVNIDCFQRSKPTNHTRICWDKIDTLKYQVEVNGRLATTDLSISSKFDLSCTIANISNILVDAARTVMPPKTSVKSRNRLWSPDIKIACVKNRDAFYRWKQAGRPSDYTHPSLQVLRTVKKGIRSSQRRELATQRSRNLCKIMSSRDSDINSMYRLVKKHKATLCSETDILEVDGTTYQGPDEVRLGWLHHYSSLAKPNSNSTESAYDNYIELDYTFLSDYCTKYSQMLPPTTTIDVMKAIQSINIRISPDVDDLTAEHFRHAGSLYCTTLTMLLNHMFRTHQVVHTSPES